MAASASTIASEHNTPTVHEKPEGKKNGVPIAAVVSWLNRAIEGEKLQPSIPRSAARG